MSDDSQHKSILVIDDDADNVLVITRMLTDAGYRVVSANSGAAGWQALGEATPDLLLLDVLMPDMMGTDLCLKIRADGRFEALLIILISGARVTPREHAYGLDIGADDYIARPFDPTEFLARIRRLFRLQEATVRCRRDAPYTALQNRGTEETSKAFRQGRLQDAYPERFAALQGRYRGALQKAVEQRLYKVEHAVSAEARELAEQLGYMGAAARDVIDLHLGALAGVEPEVSAKRYFVVKEESNILVVELMGYLVNYYRRRV